MKEPRSTVKQKRQNFQICGAVLWANGTSSKKDGIHLNEAGHRKLGEILNRECERLASTDGSSVEASSEDPSSRVQDVPEDGTTLLGLDESNSESLEGSFLGFPKENQKPLEGENTNQNIPFECYSLMHNLLEIKLTSFRH